MPRSAGGLRVLEGALLLLGLALAHPAFAQVPGAPGTTAPTPSQPPGPDEPPVTGEQPPAPAPPTAVTPAPIPVIPDVQPIGPPSTIPSAPRRLLPPVAAGLAPTATFRLQPTVTLTEEYTDNFDLTERNKKSNFRSSVSPGLQLTINSPRTNGVIAYTFMPSYDTATDDVSFFHSLLGQVVWQVNPRWTLMLADTFIRSDQPEEADALGLRQERRDFTTNTLSLTSDYLIGLVATRQSYRMTIFNDESGGDTTTHVVSASATVPIYRLNAVSAGYEYLTTETEPGSRVQGSAGAREQSSLHGHQFTGTFSREISRLATVGLKGSYALRNDTDQQGNDEDFQIWTASTFARYVLPGRLMLDGSFGVTGLTTDSGESQGPGFFTATSVSYEFGRATVSLAFNRGFSETFADGQNRGVVETTAVTGSLGYRFTPALSGRISGSYRRNDPTGLGDDVAQTSESTIWNGTVGFSWRIQQRLLLDLNYSYIDQSGGERTVDGVNINGYTENRVSAALRIVFY